jgi:transposase-like protein
MSSKIFSSEAKSKLIQLINEGMATMNEIETLTGGLSDTVKAVGEELEIKPSVLKKAIRLAHKSALGQANKDHQDINDILDLVGKTL